MSNNNQQDREKSSLNSSIRDQITNTIKDTADQSEININPNDKNQLQSLLLEVTQLATSMVEKKNKIQDILALIGQYTKVSRVYIFEDNQDRTITSNTYEWCNTGVEPQIENLQEVRYDWIPSWNQMLDKKGIIVSDNINSLPEDIYNTIAPQKIRSILVLPIKVRKVPVGFLGFDECAGNRAWGQDEINLLQTICNILANVLELEKATSELRENEKNFNQIFRLNPALMTITTFEDGVIVDVNDLFLEMAGFQYEDVIGKKTTEIEIMDPSTRKEITSRLKKDGRVRNVEIQYRFKNEDRFGLFNASFMEVDGDKYIITSVQDITRRKKTEREISHLQISLEKLVQKRSFELEKNQKYYKALIESQKDLICRWLPDTTLTFVNNAYCRFFGKKAEDLVGKKWMDFLDGQEQLKVQKKIKQLIQTGEALVYEQKTYNVDGELYWHRWMDSPIIDQKGMVIEVQSFGHDITERIIFEDKLKKAKEAAEQSDRLKTAFVQTISHELRTPLNAIMGFSDLIDKDEPIEAIMEYRDYIMRNGENLLNIIEDMLEFSVMEAGQLSLHIDQIDLIYEMNAIGRKYGESEKYKGKDIKLKLHLPDEIEELLWHTDLRRVKQIFQKLIENAFAFTQSGFIEFGFLQKETDILFFVKDTGIGISQEHQKVIFDNFRQVDDSLTRKHGGMGMGLALTKKTVEAMGGSIWVESEVGKGAAFYFTLPVNEPLEITKKKGQNYILICDDDESNRYFLTVFFKRFGFKIIVACDGAEGLEKFKSNTIDLILMDVRMPNVDGIESVREIRKIDQQVPVIGISAYAHTNDKWEAKSAGFNNFISKPLKSNELLQLVKSYLNEGVEEI